MNPLNKIEYLGSKKSYQEEKLSYQEERAEQAKKAGNADKMNYHLVKADYHKKQIRDLDSRIKLAHSMGVDTREPVTEPDPEPKINREPEQAEMQGELFETDVLSNIERDIRYSHYE